MLFRTPNTHSIIPSLPFLFQGFYKLVIFSVVIIFLFIVQSHAQNLAAPVKTSKGWGYIRKDMTWLVEPNYDRFWKDNQYVVGDHTTDKVLWEFQDGMAGIRISLEWGYIDTTGKEVIPHQFSEIRDFNESVAAVKHKGNWGFI